MTLTRLLQGGSVAQRVFHTRVLPNLMLPDGHGLPKSLHPDATKICESMGGQDGPLSIAG